MSVGVFNFRIQNQLDFNKNMDVLQGNCCILQIDIVKAVHFFDKIKLMWYPQVRNSMNQLSLICIPTCSPFSCFQHHGQIKHHMYIFFYFNEFVQNSWCFNIGINIFDLLDAKNTTAHTYALIFYPPKSNSKSILILI